MVSRARHAACPGDAEELCAQIEQEQIAHVLSHDSQFCFLFKEEGIRWSER